MLAAVTRAVPGQLASSHCEDCGAPTTFEGDCLAECEPEVDDELEDEHDSATALTYHDCDSWRATPVAPPRGLQALLALAFALAVLAVLEGLIR